MMHHFTCNALKNIIKTNFGVGKLIVLPFVD